MDDGLDSARRGSILFTAFEPSGDAHAAPVIRALKARDPNLRIYAWGGPKMAAAGAEIVEETATDGAMGLGGFLKAFEVSRIITRIDRWSRGAGVRLHVPVDSPAANFPVCKRLRRRGTKTVHLVGPQMWAWGSWRVKKLRRLTDLVLCLLPFEEAWFEDRQVPARYIGHPVIAKKIDQAAIDEQRQRFPSGSPRILILPGSRSGEIAANLRPQMKAFDEIRGRFRNAEGIILAANDAIVDRVRRRLGTIPPNVHIATDRLEAAIAWADLALATSGTVSLDLTRQGTPLIGSYAIGPLQMVVASIFVRAPYKLLPNVVAGEEVVPEFVPYCSWRGARPITAAAFDLLQDASSLKRAGRALELVRDAFGEHRPDDEAAEAILDVFDGGRGVPRDDWNRDVPSVEPASLSALEAEAEPASEATRAARARGFSPRAVDLEKRRKS